MEPSIVERYSRHIILPEIGGIGQKRLGASKVLVVGVGGLGSPILMYLTASGVGQISVIDFDNVSVSNLQRQIIFGSEDLGKSKVKVAKSKLHYLNANTKLLAHSFALSAENAKSLMIDCDLIIDGSDNTQTRYLVNKFCYELKKPLVSGGINQWDGYLSLHHERKASACYECIFPQRENSNSNLNCSDSGVFGPLAGIIGTLMASESIKYLVQAGQLLSNEMLLYDALYGKMRRVKTQQRKNCKICGSEQSC